MANLRIFNDLLDRIKVAQTDDEELQKFLTSLEVVQNGWWSSLDLKVDCGYEWGDKEWSPARSTLFLIHHLSRSEKNVH